MSQQGGGPNLKNVLLAAAVAGAIACVIGNAAGHKGGCSAEGKTTRGMECIDKKEK